MTNVSQFLGKVEEVVNEYIYEDCLKLDLEANNNKIHLSIIGECDNNETEILEEYMWDIEEEATKEEILKQIIYCFYDTEINWRNTYINGWKAFTKRKIKSMCIWNGRDNVEKVRTIEKELMERYTITERYKNQVNYYKNFIRALYEAKNKLIGEVA
ncbi:hypothetical protein [Clostridium sp. KNHs214]|uniref:hypothetical protein n=1 Tax=Clostridium sp. KNHs214 TaxID=1540257 RepID=UPI000556E7EE|nr:hypothetical protein [Clostridium sp. KNHs214]